MKIKAINKHRFSLIEDIKFLLKSKFYYSKFTFEEGDIYIEIINNRNLIISSLKSIELYPTNLYFEFYDYISEDFDLELPDETLNYIKNILTTEKPTS